ncbi:Metallophosphoesterase (plasmid) [Rhodovastum atsumiense]|uniref:Metallophosphoesterase n=1 Tax=Rhodovastum atsumiense TaxID=504468 RepID=A0A5M6IIP9_9PROT|nr:metallophosphoesterase [Rhodovastum atsumiense]KAA5608151.1 metallophosphoesterase [Rhodovastum atsumiense]CAH2605780.1 Metallophosphoesterase [Rhodovastum atsumiense]
MTLIAHLTDLHFGAEDHAVVSALAEELTGDPPDLVAVSGDLTMRARRHEFRAARAFLDGLGAPVLAVPGNHDITPFALIERFLDPYGRWRQEVAAETEPIWHNGHVAVAGLNTARRYGQSLDWSRGRVTRKRLTGLAERFAAMPAGLVRIVVAHHPLVPPEGGPKVKLVGGAERAVMALTQLGVRLVLAGHLHRGYARFASAAGDSPLIVQGATSTSVRLRGEPNAYNRIRIGADARPVISIRVWDGRAWTTRTRETGVAEAPAGTVQTRELGLHGPADRSRH